MRNSFDVHFFRRNKDEYNGFTKEHFEVSGFMSDANSVDSNLLSRMRNLLDVAIDSKLLFPKLVVIVMDNDMINYTKITDEFIEEEVYYKELSWIMKQYDRIVDIHKDRLPNKSKRPNYPPFYMG